MHQNSRKVAGRIKPVLPQSGGEGVYYHVSRSLTPQPYERLLSLPGGPPVCSSDRNSVVEEYLTVERVRRLARHTFSLQLEPLLRRFQPTGDAERENESPLTRRCPLLMSPSVWLFCRMGTCSRRALIALAFDHITVGTKIVRHMSPDTVLDFKADNPGL